MAEDIGGANAHDPRASASGICGVGDGVGTGGWRARCNWGAPARRLVHRSLGGGGSLGEGGPPRSVPTPTHPSRSPLPTPRSFPAPQLACGSPAVILQSSFGYPSVILRSFRGKNGFSTVRTEGSPKDDWTRTGAGWDADGGSVRVGAEQRRAGGSGPARSLHRHPVNPGLGTLGGDYHLPSACCRHGFASRPSGPVCRVA